MRIRNPARDRGSAKGDRGQISKLNTLDCSKKVRCQDGTLALDTKSLILKQKVFLFALGSLPTQSFIYVPIFSGKRSKNV
jgi:hypothetical protein